MHNANIHRRALRYLAVMTAAAVGMVSAIAVATARAQPAAATAAGLSISRSEVLERARHWYAQDPPRYDGADTS